jgi:hypothetical protein
MNSTLRTSFSALLGLSLATVLFASSALAQSITLNYRFDGTTTGNPVDNGATTVSLAHGTAGQTYTIDVWASIVGNAANSNTNNFGIKNIQFQGFSNVFSGAAFATGAGIGYVPGSMVGVGPFAGHINSPGNADTGNTTNGATVNVGAANLDGIVDFGKNSALSNALGSLTTGYEL